MKLLLTTRMGDPYFGLLDDLPDIQKVWATSPDDDRPRDRRRRRGVRLAIEAGIPAPLAVRYATFNGALRYRNYELGAIGPGYLADLVLVDSLERMQVQEVYVEGRHVVSEGELIVPVESRVPAPLAEHDPHPGPDRGRLRDPRPDRGG